MSASYSDIQPQRQPRKVLAIASLVLGIVSIPTLGLFGVGAIVAIVLGVIALGRIKKEPVIYGGKGMAVAGIITSVVSLLLVAVFVIVAAPRLLKRSLVTARESAAIQTLWSIDRSQVTYQVTKQRFGTLKELAEAGHLDQTYANGSAISGYVYSSSGVSEETYCVHAVRNDPAVASRDFIVCEDGIIRYVESKTPGLVKRGEGAELYSSFYSR